MSDERIRKNGATMPQAGSKTRRVWDIATKLSEKANRPATRDEVLKACEAEGISKGTRETQYSHWKRFHGLTGRVVTPGAAPAVAPKKKADAIPKPAQGNLALAPDPAPTESEEPPEYDPKVGGFVSNSEAYDTGWNDYCDGKQETDNPYEDDTQEHSDWTMGFREAGEA